MLKQIELARELSKKEYKERLPDLQHRLHGLQRACWEAGLPSVIVFEGWNASGRGSAIRKLTERLEPRGFDLHTVVAARTLEVQMPWLWRFWTKIPAYGQLAIFDRSWYRRVLFERIEEVVSPEQWERAFKDIRSFERSLADDRCEIIKVFLHIDQQTQASRLEALEANQHTAWRVGPGDWDLHGKYGEYLRATEEMLEKTETEWAPWTIVEAKDKRWARVKILETVLQRLENGLRRHGHELPEDTETRQANHESQES